MDKAREMIHVKVRTYKCMYHTTGSCTNTNVFFYVYTHNTYPGGTPVYSRFNALLSREYTPKTVQLTDFHRVSK